MRCVSDWNELRLWVQENSKNAHVFAKLVRGASKKAIRIQRLKVNYRWWHIKWRREQDTLEWREEILGICEETHWYCRWQLQIVILQRETAVGGMEQTGPAACNFIEFLRFHSSSQGEICNCRNVLWQRISVNLIQIQLFKAQGMNVIAGNIFILEVFLYRLLTHR